MNRYFAVVGVAALLILAGCTSAAGTGEEPEVSSDADVDMGVDRDAAVVCFEASSSAYSGIDCLPVSETAYEQIENVPSGTADIDRSVNWEAGVVCYEASSSAYSGIECLPVNETALANEG